MADPGVNSMHTEGTKSDQPVRKSLEGIDQAQGMWHGREAASSLVRRYSISSEEAKVTGAGQGTVMGVVFPCMANILGVLLFLRLPWIVGKAGVLQGFCLVLVCCSCTFITALSMSAVATNGKILGGGSYFLISRSLGPALGAGVGLCFYMANSIGAAMYFMGTVEAWEMAHPKLQILEAGEINNIRVTGFCILAVALCIVAGGVKIVAKLGTVFLFIVLAVIVCMYIGCIVGPNSGEADYDYELSSRPDGFRANASLTLRLVWDAANSKYFSENFGPAYDDVQYAFPLDTTDHNFISLMALWFPAVTGIMAGSNRSADLADPASSIPKGTLFAQVVTTICYLSFVLLYGAVAPRETLLHDKFFAATGSWPIKEVVIYGVMASTIGAGLTSLVSGTRLLSAIAADRTLPILSVFAVRPGKEPRLALLASGILCACAIAIGELNAVAPVLTMFFLMCYTCVNMSCTILEAVNDPNWRPRFRYHHWSISLLGAILCLWMMFAMSPLFAGIAMIFCSIIFLYASHNSHQVKWGDGWQGMKFQLARNILTKMDLTMHTKNWRPQLLVITQASIAEKETGDHEEVIQLEHPALLDMASQLKGGRGITIFGGICSTQGSDVFGDGGLFLAQDQREKVLTGQETMTRLLQAHHIEGFGRMVYVEDFSAGLLSLVQIAGLGAFQPNTLLTCWPEQKQWSTTDKKGKECRANIISLVQVGVVFQKVMLLAKGSSFPSLNERLHGNIDIWWIVADGGILLLLPFLLAKHPVWHRCHTRLFAVADQAGDDPAEVKKQLEDYVKDFRLNIEVHVKVIDAELDQMMEQAAAGDTLDAVPGDRAPGEKAELKTGKPKPTADASSSKADAGAKLPASPATLPVTESELPKKEVSTGSGLPRAKKPSDPVLESELPKKTASSVSTGSFGSKIAQFRALQAAKDGSQASGYGLGRKAFPETPPSSIGRQAAAPIGLDNVNFTAAAPSSNHPTPTSPKNADEVPGLPSAMMSSGIKGPSASMSKMHKSFINNVAQLDHISHCSAAELCLATGLNALIQQESKEAELVVTNLPDMPPGESAYGYFELVEEMTKGLKRCFLVRGTASEVITAFT
mmetsp:Transcript_54345/g.101904  ORF Transcript_54345/g.101904 Transcript_54345/m.101904 type:complete len:1094 (-) Transcript_54345:9-3290(-)